MLSNWQSVLKIKTNVDTKENHCDFIVTNEVWVAAGGRPEPRYDRNIDNEPQEGYRFMDIEDIEESIGRKLTPEDFLPSPINAFTKNKTAIDRMGSENHERFGRLSLIAPPRFRHFCNISDINAHKYFIEHFPNSRSIDTIKEQLKQLEGE